jgi:hypothetical protein
MFIGEHRFSMLAEDHCTLGKRWLYPWWADHASAWALPLWDCILD